MKVKELKQIIREAIEEMGLNEMARIATGFKFADDWESKWGSVPDGIKNSIRYKRIIDYLSDEAGLPKDITGASVGTLKDVAMKKFNSADTAAVNQLVRTLKDLGILVDGGAMAAKKADLGLGGASTDPKKTALRKMAAGDTNFTPEELAFIKGMIGE